MRLAVLLAVFLTVPAFCTAQTTWYVPDDFTTIQGAISDASVVDGDTVVVRPGTYKEKVDFAGKAITLKSESGPDITVIDGNGTLGATVTFQRRIGRTKALLSKFKEYRNSKQTRHLRFDAQELE